uniref:Uncharacterized protein n=1 Tax=Rhizobium rhizogenes TaxID=359 RepID=A0A7S5DS66_RHIRH|nr:hypothetical protein pC6.5b_361 [Rhizobium rhizogenes]
MDIRATRSWIPRAKQSIFDPSGVTGLVGVPSGFALQQDISWDVALTKRPICIDCLSALSSLIEKPSRSDNTMISEFDHPIFGFEPATDGVFARYWRGG